VLHNTISYDCGRSEPLVFLSLSLSDNLCLRVVPFKGSILGEEFSTGGIGEALRDDAEEKSESESDSDELEDSKVTRRRWAIMMAEGWIQTITESKMCARGHENTTIPVRS
jgi:hypothetical protein